MIKATLKEVAAMVGGELNDNKYEHVEIAGVSIDSRAVEAGNLYIPIIGARSNGHTYIDSAITSGATATFWQRGQEETPPKVAPLADVPIIFVTDTQRALQDLGVAYKEKLGFKVVGITGSNGKTSTKDILASMLAEKFRVHKTPGNLNSEFGMPLTLLMAPTDTEIAVLEMGMRGLGQIALLSNLAKPDACMITNIGEAHIEELGSRENISIAKMEIVSGLKRDGFFTYDGDEPLLTSKIPNLDPSFELATFGEGEGNKYRALDVKIDGSSMIFNIPQSDVTFKLPALGFHNVMNTLASIAVARHFGVDDEAMAKGLTKLEMSSMRMDVSKSKLGATIIDDSYNSSPTAVRKVLDLVYALTGYQKKIVVLGDMLELGEHEVKYHEEIGATIDPEQIDTLMTYGILAKHIATASKVKNVQIFDDKAELIRSLEAMAGEGNVILIKGSRGMQLDEVVKALS